MEEYKSHFDYQTLENYLMNNKEYSDSFVRNKYYLSPEKIKNFVENLPIEYINKINKEKPFDKNKTFDYERKGFNTSIRYTYNNNIIDYKIYGLLIKKLNDSLKANELYFIGNKKLLLLFPNKTEFDQDIYEIGFINEKGMFIPEYLLESNNKTIFSLADLNFFFKKDFFNFFLNLTSDSCNINNEHNISIGCCYKISHKENNLESNKGEYTKLKNSQQFSTKNEGNFQTKKPINPYVELIINIYLFKEELKNKINKKMKDKHEEKYYIIRKKWMDKLKQALSYDDKLKKYLESGDFKNIINKYNPKEKYDEFISEVMNLLSEDYLNNINNNLTKEEYIKDLISSQYYSMKLKEKNNIYYYYDNIEIIDDKIEKIIQKLFKLEYNEKRIFLFGDNKIIMDLELTSQYSIIIGHYNNNYFETDLLLQFSKKEEINTCFQKFTSEGYYKSYENLTFKQNNEIIIKKDDSNIIGKVYKISELEKNLISSSNIENKSEITPREIETSDIFNQNNNNLTQSQTQMIINRKKLDFFMENQIKALISYFLFTEKIKNVIKSSKKNRECYLIDENWMKSYTKFFLYEDIIQQINKITSNNSNYEGNVENIYEKFEYEFLNKIRAKEITKPKDNAKEISQILNSFPKENSFIDSGNDKDIEKYNNFKFNIIDEETYNFMNHSPHKILSDVKKREYLINEGKLFIKILPEAIKKYEILISSSILENNYFIPELLLKYDSNILLFVIILN